MAAITPDLERIDGLQDSDVLELENGIGREIKRMTVAEVLRYGWDDLRFPTQGINPAGAVDAPSVDTTLTDFPGTLLFSGSQVNVIAVVVQMPHAWLPGSSIEPHIHWSKPIGTANAVTWGLYYRHFGFPNDFADDWVGPITGTISAGDPTLSNSHIITGFGIISMTGKRESSVLCWQIRRQGSTDADAGVARLLEFDIHYYSVKAGTVTPIPPAP